MKNAKTLGFQKIERQTYALVNFIATDAPRERFSLGTAFEVFEGPRPVAKAQVLLSERMMAQLVAHAA